MVIFHSYVSLPEGKPTNITGGPHPFYGTTGFQAPTWEIILQVAEKTALKAAKDGLGFATESTESLWDSPRIRRY